MHFAMPSSSNYWAATPSFETQCAKYVVSSEKVALQQLQFQIVLSKSVKNNAQAVKIFFSSVQEDDHVVKVDEAVYQIQLS